jgi:glycosyltransferase involved in cell wall biosynthesis
MLSVHNTVDTWSDSVDLYICPSEAMRQHFIGGGFPPRRLVVKPHFICEVKPPAEPKGNYLLFAGRLTREKGILTLLDACRTAGPRCRLKIAGDGPLAPEVRDFVRRHHWAEWVGHVGACQMKSLIAGANAVVIPSEWEEPFGLIAIEAFSFGTPVIASRVGALPEIVDHLRTGLLFTPHHARELAAHMSWVFDHPVEVGSMARMACVEAGTTYAAETNYAQLIAAYERAVCRPDSASLTPPTLSTRVATPEVLSNALLSH